MTLIEMDKHKSNRKYTKKLKLKQAKAIRNLKWHYWFAWYPILIKYDNDYSDIIWWEGIKRKGTYMPSRTTINRFYPEHIKWEYST